MSDDIFDTLEILGQPGGQSLHLRFGGGFEGRRVTWDARLEALGSQGGCNFIEVGDDGERGIPLHIGLRVTRIDEPTVRKAVIMIRRYKRLRRGRHEW